MPSDEKAWLGKILHNDFADASASARFNSVLVLISFRFSPRNIDRGFAPQRFPTTHPSLQSFRFEPARSSWVVCSTIDSTRFLINCLALKTGSSLN